ncbi:uroporphyrinogen-III synthase [Neobacillus sp. SM06]|uniref:uroporphyrinogen-III synthase n=1 Tax=Neobacillus sp. SM06 TaxID=3422492 RepID=UPI003D2C8A10
MTAPPPLKNKKVLIPRGEKQAEAFSKLVGKYGGIPVEIPLIAFRPVKRTSALERFLQRLNQYDWIIFTSNVAVDTFLSFLDKASFTSLPKIAVIGKKTAQVVSAKGLKVEFTPSQYVAETFVTEFSSLIQPGMTIFIPKGNLAREYIGKSLRKKGAVVDEAIVYETYLPVENRAKLSEMIVAGKLDILLFTSPSTVDHFMEIVSEYELKDHLADCLIGCIGPITEKKLFTYGLPVHASPKVYTVEEMVKCMITYLEEKNRGV